jgi:hypothetical protein
LAIDGRIGVFSIGTRRPSETFRLLQMRDDPNAAVGIDLEQVFEFELLTYRGDPNEEDCNGSNCYRNFDDRRRVRG